MTNETKFTIVNNDFQESIDLTEQLRQKLFLLKFNEDKNNPDYIFIIGGDGTFISAIRQYNTILAKTKIIAFKLGKVSFYHNFVFDDVEKILKALKDKNNTFYQQKLELLEITTENNKYYALNEFRLINVVNTISFDINLNQKLLESFRGSGVIIATKNGSTGLIKTAGGAVMLAKTKLMELQEIFPVNNNSFRTINAPVILDYNDEITLKFNKVIIDNNTKIVIDTFPVHDKLFKEIKIKISDIFVTNLSFSDENEKLISKIKETFIDIKN